MRQDESEGQACNGPARTNMPLTVDDVRMYRDGGTITFSVRGDALVGRYRLRTPFHGEPRRLYRNEQELVFGGQNERDVLAGLQAWLDTQLTADMVEALSRLDSLKLWLNLPQTLRNAVPVHRMRAVIRCLEARAAPQHVAPDNRGNG